MFSGMLMKRRVRREQNLSATLDLIVAFLIRHHLLAVKPTTGNLSQEAKDAFFEALMVAYVTCKEEAKKTYGRKKKEE